VLAPTNVQSLEEEVPVATYNISLVVSTYCCQIYVGVVAGAQAQLVLSEDIVNVLFVVHS
jgi:hypothetical protein